MTKKRSLLEDKKEWTKKAILTAAKKVFLEMGYVNTTCGIRSAPANQPS